MAVGIVFEGAGVSQAQYEQVLNELSPDNQPPPGLLYHAAGPSENGFCVVEVWESQDVADQFFKEKLGQALQNAQINSQPKFFQVVNIMKP